MFIRSLQSRRQPISAPALIQMPTLYDANADTTANNDRRIGFNVTLTVILVYRARGIAILREYLV